MGFFFKFICTALFLLLGAFAGLSLIKYIDKEPKAITLSMLDDDKKIEGKDILADSPHNSLKLAANVKENEEFWIWKFKNVLVPDLQTLGKESVFKKVITGFNLDKKSNENSLNKVCEVAYKTTKKEIQDNYKKDISKYCTIGETSELITE